MADLETQPVRIRTTDIQIVNKAYDLSQFPHHKNYSRSSCQPPDLFHRRGAGKSLHQHIPLRRCYIAGGVFQHARDLNIRVLLEYDTDRLIAPFRKEAGLPAKATLYPNWEGLDGHVGGHYLSALAMNYASTGNRECKRRMLYMIRELKSCQEANGRNNPDWGKGYVGVHPTAKRSGVPCGKGTLRLTAQHGSPGTTCINCMPDCATPGCLRETGTPGRFF